MKRFAVKMCSDFVRKTRELIEELAFKLVTRQPRSRKRGSFSQKIAHTGIGLGWLVVGMQALQNWAWAQFCPATMGTPPSGCCTQYVGSSLCCVGYMSSSVNLCCQYVCRYYKVFDCATGNPTSSCQGSFAAWSYVNLWLNYLCGSSGTCTPMSSGSSSGSNVKTAHSFHRSMGKKV